MRRDALENRQRVLAAASQVFTEHGIDAGVEEIARVAGVGMGTVYRRFPTKEALIAELVHDMLEHLLVAATDVIDAPDGLGLERYLEASGAYQSAHRGCLPRLWRVSADDVQVRELRRRIAVLLDRAKQHGRVRAEVTPTDVTVVMWSIRDVIETTGEVAPNAWRRHLDLLIAGLRPSDQPLRHSALTRTQVDRILATD